MAFSGIITFHHLYNLRGPWNTRAIALCLPNDNGQSESCYVRLRSSDALSLLPVLTYPARLRWLASSILSRLTVRGLMPIPIVEDQVAMASEREAQR